MEPRLSAHIGSFVLAIKRYLRRFRLTIDGFLFDIKLKNTRLITLPEFTRIVQRINDYGESFNHVILFQ